MKKIYMPKDVFEVGVSSIAKVHLVTEKSIEEVANVVWNNYSEQIIDDGVVEDMVTASKRAIDLLQEWGAPSIPELFTHFQHFCIHCDDAGEPKKKKIFNGLRFQKSIKDEERIKRYLKKLEVYYIGAKSGLMPLAPDGWSLSGD